MAIDAFITGTPQGVAELSQVVHLTRDFANTAPNDFEIEAACALARFVRDEFMDAPIRSRQDALIKMEIWREELAEALDDHTIADQVIAWMRSGDA